MISSADIHARIDWPATLTQLGIPETALSGKHGPCPKCGGKDCFRFNHARRGNGSFYCNKFGDGGDGFKLLEHVFGWQFSEARKRVIEAAGLSQQTMSPISVIPPRAPEPVSFARPSRRVLQLRRERCAIEDCDCAVDYLASRLLWPPPDGSSLRSHAALEYWNGDQRIGRFPAIVADVVDLAGELVTCHVTWLSDGKKLTGYEPRKLLGAVIGRTGCAVRLSPAANVLGIAEGIETALSAAVIDDVPVWAALNTSLLAKFEPPPGVQQLRVYADRDEAGLTAALHLFERLQGRVCLEIRIPPAPANDWNEVLISRHSRSSGEGKS